MNRPTLLYEIALSMVEGVGAVTAKNLLSYAGSAEQVFKLSESKLLKIPQVGAFIAKMIQKKETLIQAEKELEAVLQHQIQVLFFADEKYPQRLKSLYDAPILLYYKGTANLDMPKTVAIVGTRQSSEYGKEITEMLIHKLQPHQPLIVSGLAYGIDVIAHKAALKCQLPTIGVMASGMDNIYPAIHKKIAQQMIEQQGGILTENPLGTKPDAMRFPARNRIIAGLADAVIVVEAKTKGGALITANLANNYHKDVFAVPGNIFSSTSAGCHQLVKDHQAHLLTDIADLEYILGWDVHNPNQTIQTSLNFDTAELTEDECNIVEFLQLQPNQEAFLDEISWKLGLSASKIGAGLVNLEILGLIQTLPGKKITLQKNKPKL